MPTLQRTAVAEAPRPAAARIHVLAPTGLRARASDCLALTKPRVTLLVVITAVVSGYMGALGAEPLARWLALAAGTGLLAGGTAALNQAWERHRDGLMARTASRPLPAGRLAPPPAVLFGLVTAAAGLALLATDVNPLCAWLGLATSLSYLLLYTPLKAVSPISTLVGAFPGAGPVLMGWAAMRGHLDTGAWILFGIQFLWQFPHFLAIARLYREQYQNAGIRMLPVVDVDGSETGRQVLLYCLALLPLSLLPALAGLAGPIYFAGAAVAGAWLLWVAAGSVRARTAPAYRRLLRATILYLPVVFALMALDRLPGR